MNILWWATASQQKALDNARAAAVECSRRLVERAEVEQALTEINRSYDVPVITTAAAAR